MAVLIIIWISRRILHGDGLETDAQLAGIISVQRNAMHGNEMIGGRRREVLLPDGGDTSSLNEEFNEEIGDDYYYYIYEATAPCLRIA